MDALKPELGFNISKHVGTLGGITLGDPTAILGGVLLDMGKERLFNLLATNHIAQRKIRELVQWANSKPRTPTEMEKRKSELKTDLLALVPTLGITFALPSEE